MTPCLNLIKKVGAALSNKATSIQTSCSIDTAKAMSIGNTILTTGCRKRKGEEAGVEQVKRTLIPASNSQMMSLPSVSQIKKEMNEVKKEENPHLEIFLQKLRDVGDIEAGKKMKKSLKSSHTHLGVNAPQCAKLALETSKHLDESQILVLAKDLWKTSLFEAMICSAKLLELPKVNPSEALWQLILTFLEDIDNWSIEDQLAKAAQKCILADEKRLDEVEKWTEHTSFWVRRAALVYTLPFAKKGQVPERMLTWATKYASDEEWFIQKAIGWWIRELGTHNPQAAYEYLNQNWCSLQSVAKKEGTRKLGAEWVQKLPRKH